MLLRQDDHLLFFGDSITDAAHRIEKYNNCGLGYGYVSMVAARLACEYSDLNVRITNRGNSGNRVSQLEERLEADVLAEKPTVVSILVGINDAAYRAKGRGTLSLDDFAASYRRVCKRIKEDLSARLILCEPFLLPTPEDRLTWQEDFFPRVEIVRDLAREFADRFVAMDGLFTAAACRKPMEFWLYDGVHPTSAGAGIVADAWMKTVVD
jgi:lysophospholipase L1-like esterase